MVTGNYLIIAFPGAEDLSYAQLQTHLRCAMSRLAGGTR